MNPWIAFVIYVIYRSIRVLVHFIQDELIWRLNGIRAHLRDMETSSNSQYEDDCQVLKILGKKKLIEKGDITSPNDFIWQHDKFVSGAKFLALDPTWSLYTMDSRFVYFVKTQEPWSYYNARRAPFVSFKQYAYARGLARMPLNAFCRFAEQWLCEPKGPVVYFSIAARSGSTLLTRVLQVDDRITCFGRPDALTNLSILYQRGLISENSLPDLLRSIMKFYCKTQQPGQAYVIKVAANCALFVPHLKRCMPRVKHMFTFRRNTQRAINSAEKVLRTGCGSDVSSVLWNISPELTCELISMGGFEYELFKRFGLHDCLDQAIVLHVSSWYQYYKNRDLFDVPLIHYEDLVAEKEETLRRVFELCELPYDEVIGEAMREFQRDSQGGTLISRDNLRTVTDTPLDVERIKKMNEMCDQLKVPRLHPSHCCAELMGGVRGA